MLCLISVRTFSPSSERCSFDSNLTPAFLALEAVAMHEMEKLHGIFFITYQC